MAMTPAHDAFTLNNRYSTSHTTSNAHRHTQRSPPPTAVSVGIGKLARRNSNSKLAVKRRSAGVNGLAIGGIDEVKEGVEEKNKTAAVDWEIPRKTFHASIGFFVLPLYISGTTTRPTIMVLSGILGVVGVAEVVRLQWPWFEGVYERVLGGLMREGEKYKINGTVWYLIGVLIVLCTLPLDLAVVSILILSWADTSASTFGRLFGRRTRSLPPRLPFLRLPLARRKSWAGFIAATVTAGAVAAGFWGWIAREDEAVWSWERGVLGTGVLSGWEGLGVLGSVTGVIAGVAEALDLGSLDDNLTLPVLAGGVLYAVLRTVEWLF